jgi:hypothetical protein
MVSASTAKAADLTSFDEQLRQFLGATPKRSLSWVFGPPQEDENRQFSEELERAVVVDASRHAQTSLGVAPRNPPA